MKGYAVNHRPGSIRAQARYSLQLPERGREASLMLRKPSLCLPRRQLRWSRRKHC